MELSFDFIFYHIPKCGGTSLREYFKSFFKNLGYDNKIYIANSKNKNLMNEEILKNMYPILEKKSILLSHINCKLYDKLNSKYCVTSIRNPINRYISSFNHFDLLEDNNKNLLNLFKQNKLKPVTIYDKRNWFRENTNDYNHIIVIENLKNDLELIKKDYNINKNIYIPNLDPAKKTKKFKNYFKLDITKKDHIELYNFLKKKLKIDIDIYNKICLKKNLINLIII